MTTTITVAACVAPGKQVRVKRTGYQDVVMQDGEKQDFHVYNDMALTVNEEDTPAVMTESAPVDVGGDGPGH